MIHSFSCKNFYSFKDEVTVSFVVNENAPKTSKYFEMPSGVRLSKAIVVAGSNASGKTTLLKVLPFLHWIILHSFKNDPEASLPIKMFEFGGIDKKGPIEVSVIFEIDGGVYNYLFRVTTERILFEELKLTQFLQEKKSTKTLFKREWDERSNTYFFKDSFNLPNEFKNSLRTNASVVSSAMRFNHAQSCDIGSFWKRFSMNVMEAGWVGDQLFSADSGQPLFSALSLCGEDDTLKRKIVSILKSFDFGLSDLNIEKKKTDDGFTLGAYVVHSFNGEDHALNLSYESSGTKQGITHLAYMLPVLMRGGVVVLDEFEVNLHPHIVREFFNLFISSETDLNKSQIILSTHSHSILSELDKYQIVLVEKGENGSSDAWRLDEVQDVRLDENYYAKYIAGAYGAVPNIT